MLFQALELQSTGRGQRQALMSTTRALESKPPLHSCNSVRVPIPEISIAASSTGSNCSISKLWDSIGKHHVVYRSLLHDTVHAKKQTYAAT